MRSLVAGAVELSRGRGSAVEKEKYIYIYITCEILMHTDFISKALGAIMKLKLVWELGRRVMTLSLE